jgi:hypothetical protein
MTNQRIGYVERGPADEALQVILEVPWEPHSGMIPPPTIDFVTGGRVIEFMYAGNVD